MSQQFVENDDVARAVGGWKVLNQLLDKDGDGYADPPLLDGIRADATGEMASLIERAVELGGLRAPYPRILVTKTAHVAAFLAWGQGGDTQAMPDWVQKIYDAAIRWGHEVGDRTASMGVVQRPDLDPPAHIVDPDPAGRGVSVRGFKRGFR